MGILPQLADKPVQEQTVRVEQILPPGALQRLFQGATTVLFVHVLLAILLTIFILVLDGAGMEAQVLPARSPVVYRLAGLLLPLAATALAVALCLHKVYLAQLVGAVAGAVAAVLILFERQALGLDPILADWVVFPLASGMVGFLAGLRVAGKLVVLPAFEYKPVDAWDRDAKPVVRELPPPPMRVWNRLALGFAVGLGCSLFLESAFHFMLLPMYGYNRHSVGAVLAQIELLTNGLSFLLAGVAAGSGTRSGAVQGLACGALLYGFLSYFYPPQTYSEGTLELAGYLGTTMVGGMIGRRILGPIKVYGGPTLGG